MSGETLLLSPLTDSEVYKRTDKALDLLARCVLQGDHETMSYWRSAFDKNLDEARFLKRAEEQRLHQRVHVS